MGPRCFKCLMFSPSGPVELVFLVDLRAADVCAIVIFMGVIGSDTKSRTQDSNRMHFRH